MKKRIRTRFLWIQYELWEHPEITGSDLLVYGVLARFADNETQTCFPSITKICELGRVTRKTAIKSLINLEKIGAICKIGKKKRNHLYALLDIGGKIPLVETNQTSVEKNTLSSVEKDTAINTHLINTHITRYASALPTLDKTFFSSIYSTFEELFLKKYKNKPQINYAKDGRMIKQVARDMLRRANEKGVLPENQIVAIKETIENILTWYFQNQKSEEFPTLAAALSTATINSFIVQRGKK